MCAKWVLFRIDTLTEPLHRVLVPGISTLWFWYFRMLHQYLSKSILFPVTGTEHRALLIRGKYIATSPAVSCLKQTLPVHVGWSELMTLLPQPSKHFIPGIISYLIFLSLCVICMIWCTHVNVTFYSQKSAHPQARAGHHMSSSTAFYLIVLDSVSHWTQSISFWWVCRIWTQLLMLANKHYYPPRHLIGKKKKK